MFCWDSFNGSSLGFWTKKKAKSKTSKVSRKICWAIFETNKIRDLRCCFLQYYWTIIQRYIASIPINRDKLTCTCVDSPMKMSCIELIFIKKEKFCMSTTDCRENLLFSLRSLVQKFTTVMFFRSFLMVASTSRTLRVGSSSLSNVFGLLESRLICNLLVPTYSGPVSKFRLLKAVI